MATKLIKTIFSLSIFIAVFTVYVQKNIINKSDNPKPETIAMEVTQLTNIPSISETKVLGSNSQNIASKSDTTKQSSNIKFGIVVDDYENKHSTVSDLEKKLKLEFSTISIYVPFGGNGKGFPKEKLLFAKKTNKKLLLAWEPWNPEEDKNQSKDFLKEIANGNENSYLRSFATDIKAYGGEVVIRFGHEQNGNWYPWGNRPNDYVRAYRHIVDLFKEEKVDNVAWSWSVNFENIPSSNISSIEGYYPGDNYVDSIGIDGFNYGSTQGWSKWKTFSEIFTQPYNYLIKYHKPLYISETSSTEQGGNKAEWIGKMMKDLPQKFPEIKEIIWFNLLKETDWRIDSSESSLKSFMNNPTP